MDTTIELHARPHPDPRVRRLGFDLTHPYVEQCWGAVIGPSAVVILRRLPVLWAQHEPAQFPADALAASLGLGLGAGQNGRFHRSLERLSQFRLAEWIERGTALAVYTEVTPFSASRVARVPEWTREAHERLLGAHLDGIATETDHGARIAEITARLDRLERPSAPQLQSNKGIER